jgi:hypothetical protein
VAEETESHWSKSPPVVVLSRNFTYFPPEELLCVQLSDPMVLSFGTSGSVSLRQSIRHVHLQLPSVVRDRVEMAADEEQTVSKTVRLAKAHGALVFQRGKLRYKHLCTAPTIVAERVFDPTLIESPNEIVELTLGKSVGFGQTQDVFGEVMWWYYLRLYTLGQLKRLARKIREEEWAQRKAQLAAQGLMLLPDGRIVPIPAEPAPGEKAPAPQEPPPTEPPKQAG